MRKLYLVLAFIFTLFGIGILIWILWRGFRYEGFIDSSKPLDLSISGLFGDFIGGFVGTIFAFVGLLLLYETLALQRKEFSASKSVFVKQQFDNTFFELIKLYNSIVEGISIVDPTNNNQRIVGKKFFDSEMERMQNSFTTQRALSLSRKNAVNDYQNFYVSHKNITSVYFKTLYRIYCLIEYSELSIKDKRTYAKILRALLSESELFFIRYNAMTEYGRKSGRYLNKYNILKHLSHFELLEFKDWWTLVTPIQRNGLDFVLKEIKEVINSLLKNPGFKMIPRHYKKGRYIIEVLNEEDSSAFSIIIIRDISKTSIQSSVVDGFDLFSDQQLENLLTCFVKELVISSNFNQFNNRRNLEFFEEIETNGTISTIIAGVKNNTGENLMVLSNMKE